MTETVSGHCFCKAVRFEIDLPIKWCVSCHCESCRRQCSSPMVTYVGVNDTQWRWTGQTAKIYMSTPGVERTFCGDCGTPLTFRSERMTGLMHFYLAALEDPERFEPQLHTSYEEKLCWLNVVDDLPRKEGPEVVLPG